MEENKTKYTHRFLAKIVIEALTPFAVGSGEKNITTDALVINDVNGLPYIPGTALAGIIRHVIGETDAKSFFGYQATGKSKEGRGSEIIFSSAQLIGKYRQPIDGINQIESEDNFCLVFKNLPIRQHVHINEKGAAEKTGKYDEQIVFKGTRFCFEIEMVAENDTLNNFNLVMDQLHSKTLRIGSGTRIGFGEMKIVDCKKAILNMKNEIHFNAYVEKSSCLSNDEFWEKDFIKTDPSTERNLQNDWIEYELHIIPDDFFLFGSGYGNEKADMTPVSGTFIDWSNKDPAFKKDNILIPAASVKGALSHRVSFYYNKLNELFAGNSDAKTGTENLAVRTLFGNDDSKDLQRGNVLFSDIIDAPKNTKLTTKVLNHVSIDRFTGGAIDGALFTEEVIYGDTQEFKLKLLVNTIVLKQEKVIESLECALKDITSGMLALGGGVNRGNGCFAGSILKNGEKLL